MLFVIGLESRLSLQILKYSTSKALLKIENVKILIPAFMK